MPKTPTFYLNPEQVKALRILLVHNVKDMDSLRVQVTYPEAQMMGMEFITGSAVNFKFLLEEAAEL